MSPKFDSSSSLRKKAEVLHGQQSSEVTDLSTLSTEEVHRLIHELQVHQIELELQNEELQNAQNELEVSRDKYSDLYDFAPVAYFTMGETGLIEEANLTGARLLGVERHALIGQPLSRFVSPDHQDIYYLHRNKIIETLTSQHCEIDMLKKNGTSFSGELTGVFIDKSEDSKNRYRLAINDITLQVIARKDIQKRQNLESLGFLAGGIAHDFNNILTVIFTNLQLLERTLPKNTAEYECVTDAWEATLRTKNLTSQLLTFATGGTPFKTITSIEEMIQKTSKLSLSGSNTKAEYHFPDNLLLVDIDIGQINRVIQNVVINADQAMPNGGILNISAENITLSDENVYALKPGHYVKIAFTDQGGGMTEDVLKHIFDPYFTTKQAGNGLGLAIVYSIISRHDGHITVHSKVDTGTMLEILLPASEKKPAVTHKKQIGVPTGSVKILLMDDEEIIRRTIGRILEKLGHVVDSVPDGTQALQAYQTSVDTDVPYHIVIMDLTIPGGMGGREAIQHLLSKHPNARVIVTSGYANDPIMKDYKTYGFKGRIHKPIDLIELTNTIEKVLVG
jgi:two-component system, cell cycle sensor histidine kinase and response regulator CckA